jgi:hypothetical protein
MSRDWRLFLQDIVDAGEKVQRYTRGLDFSDFVANELVFDAVVRNLEVIGEAARKCPKISASAILRWNGGPSPGCGIFWPTPTSPSITRPCGTSFVRRIPLLLQHGRSILEEER